MNCFKRITISLLTEEAERCDFARKLEQRISYIIKFYLPETKLVEYTEIEREISFFHTITVLSYPLGKVFLPLLNTIDFMRQRSNSKLASTLRKSHYAICIKIHRDKQTHSLKLCDCEHANQAE